MLLGNVRNVPTGKYIFADDVRFLRITPGGGGGWGKISRKKISESVTGRKINWKIGKIFCRERIRYSRGQRRFLFPNFRKALNILLMTHPFLHGPLHPPRALRGKLPLRPLTRVCIPCRRQISAGEGRAHFSTLSTRRPGKALMLARVASREILQFLPRSSELNAPSADVILTG